MSTPPGHLRHALPCTRSLDTTLTPLRLAPERRHITSPNRMQVHLRSTRPSGSGQTVRYLAMARVARHLATMHYRRGPAPKLQPNKAGGGLGDRRWFVAPGQHLVAAGVPMPEPALLGGAGKCAGSLPPVGSRIQPAISAAAAQSQWCMQLIAAASNKEAGRSSSSSSSSSGAVRGVGEAAPC